MKFLIEFAAINADKLPQVAPNEGTLRSILRFVFALAGAIALVIITLAGFKYSLSRGDANAIKNAKEIIIYALVGLLVAIFGFSLVTFILNRTV
jgi:hypothetical protein